MKANDTKPIASSSTLTLFCTRPLLSSASALGEIFRVSPEEDVLEGVLGTGGGDAVDEVDRACDLRPGHFAPFAHVAGEDRLHRLLVEVARSGSWGW